MIISPDFSEAVERVSEPIPDGVYKARITDVEVKKSKAGATYLKWKLSLFGNEGELAKYNNWPVFHSTMTSGKGAGMLKDFYKAAMREEISGQFDAQALLAKEVQIAIAAGRMPDGSPSQWPDVKSVKAL